MSEILVALGAQIFNSYDILITVIFVESLLFSIFYYYQSRVITHVLTETRADHNEQKENRAYNAKLLSLFMLLVGCTELVFLLTYNPIVYRVIFENLGAFTFSVLALLFYYPGVFLYRYVTSLVYPGRRDNRLFLLPLVVFAGAILFVQLGGFGPGLAKLFWRPHIFVATVGFTLNTVFAALAMVQIHRYQQQLLHYFGNIDPVDIFWLRMVTGGFGMIWFMALVPPFLPIDMSDIVRQIIIHVPSVIEIVLLTFAVLFGLSQSVRIVNVLPALEELDEVPETGEGDNRKETRITREDLAAIENLMENEKLYRNSNLTVEQFAEGLAMPVKQVSFAINRHFEKNFYEFVNHYRIQEAKHLLRYNRENRKSIQDIYEAVGFRSKSSFNTLFKRWVGMTPSQYREKYGDVAVAV